ncbi:hypothetical protein ACFOY2_47740 [Nonomuraea purpurea]|uniref:MarR family transcriptional regulator n=1 Tax=Nonomuraea purpurea TaxID=1849276 RepID=A0ABV8GPQ0_9ACTN
MATLDALLAGLARERSTGALRLGRNGTIFLSDGRVTYMECAQTPNVERMLTARGRMTEAALRGLQADGGCERLLAEGAVTRGELQYAVLGVVLDAAFFLLPTGGTRPKFRPGERHWLGGQWFFDVAGLVRECARRRACLAETWPSADVDMLPVRPMPWLPGHAVTLTRVQWEVVVGADHKATPLELAKQIGRSGYSVLLAVRQLAAAGLLAAPDPGRATSAEKGPAPSTEPEAGRLPKRARHPYARPPHDPGAAAQPLGPPVTGDPTDLALLMRLKKALEELS